MFAVVGSERDPVRADDLYASKRPDSLFYLAINHTTTAVNTKPWFKAAPMGVNKLKSLMKAMAEKAGLDAKHISSEFLFLCVIALHASFY